MNNKLTAVFENDKALIGFITAGDPDMETCREITLKAVEAGCNIIELGIPFSDPIAEGVSIQQANIRALKGGATTDKILDMAKEITEKAGVPIVIRTYLNVLFCYGYKKFFEKAADCGVCAVVVPDLPYEEKHELSEEASPFKIDVISMIAPAPAERISLIASQADGFVYIQPSAKSENRYGMVADAKALTAEAKKAASVPAVVEASSRSAEEAAAAAATADGVIIGSALVEIAAENPGNAPQAVAEFVSEVKSRL